MGDTSWREILALHIFCEGENGLTEELFKYYLKGDHSHIVYES